MSGLIRLVARRVQQLRRERGLTQQAMQDCGFNYRYYQRVEGGEKNLSLRTLNKIARAFGVDPRDLLTFDSK